LPGVNYLKYGGVKFVPNVPVSDINRFVDGLPRDQRGSIYSVASALKEQGLISVVSDGDMGTVDSGFKALMDWEYSQTDSNPRTKEFL